MNGTLEHSDHRGRIRTLNYTTRLPIYFSGPPATFYLKYWKHAIERINNNSISYFERFVLDGPRRYSVLQWTGEEVLVDGSPNSQGFDLFSLQYGNTCAVSLFILKVDLDIIHPATGELDEAREDADQRSGIVAVKRDDETPVTQLKIHASSSLPAGSKVGLLFTNGSGENTRYRIWKNADFTDEIISSTTELDATIEHTLYIEGLSKSSAESGESVKQVYTVGTTVFEGDEVKFTVVEAEFDVWLNLFIPVQWGELPFVFDAIPPLGRKLFGGDDRGFYELPFENPADDVDREESSSRTHQQITVIPFKDLDSDGIKDGSKKQAIGESHNYLKSESVPFPDQDYSPTNRLLPDPTVTSVGTGSVADENMDVSVEFSEGTLNTVYVEFGYEADNPIVDPSLPINWSLRLRLSSSDIFLPEFILTGLQDGFPGYEMYVRDSDGDDGAPEGTVVHQYDPIALGLDPSSLQDGVNDVNVFEQGVVE